MAKNDFDLHANYINAIQGCMRAEAERMGNTFLHWTEQCIYHITAMLLSLDARIKELEGEKGEKDETEGTAESADA